MNTHFFHKYNSAECLFQFTNYMSTSYIYQVFRPSHDSSAWLGFSTREQPISPECSKHQVLSFAKAHVVWWTNKEYVVISILQSAQRINSERIYLQTYVLSFPGIIRMAQVTKWRTTVIRVLKAPGAELCQNAWGVVNKQKIFCFHQCSPENRIFCIVFTEYLFKERETDKERHRERVFNKK